MPFAFVNCGLTTCVQFAAPGAGRWNSPPEVATRTSGGLSGSITSLVHPSPARFVASSDHVPSAPPPVETRTPMPNQPRKPPRYSPVPTKTWLAARSAPNATASAPTESELATRLGTGAAGVVTNSSSGSHVLPPSGENHAPPSAVPT